MSNPWTARPLPRRPSRAAGHLHLIVFATLVVILLVGAAAAVYLLLFNNTETEAPIVTTLDVELPSGWESTPLTQDEQRAGLLLGATHDSPDASLLVRGVPGRPVELLDVSALGDEIEAALDAEIDGFELVSRGVADWGSFEAVQIYYRQLEGTIEHQAMMVVIPTERQTFYLTLRAGTDVFPDTEAEGREIFNSIVAHFEDAGLSPP